MHIDWVATTIALLTFFGIAAIIALSLNLEYGLAGIPNFGQALFVAIGAFTAGVTCTRLMPLLARRAALDPCGATNMAPALALRSQIRKTMPAVALGNFALTLLIAAVIGGIVGLVAAYPALRLKEEWFLGLVLLVGAETVRIFVRGYEPIICAYNGLSGLAQLFAWLGNAQQRSLAFLGLVLVVLILCYWPTASTWRARPMAACSRRFWRASRSVTSVVLAQRLEQTAIRRARQPFAVPVTQGPHSRTRPRKASERIWALPSQANGCERPERPLWAQMIGS